MPRRRRASYGVQKKYKRARYMSGSDKLDESGSDKLNEAFLESDNSLNIHDSTDVLNEGFFETDSSVCETEYFDKECQTFIEVVDTGCQVQTDDGVFCEDFDVPTQFESIKRDLSQNALPEPYVLKPNSRNIEVLSFYEVDGHSAVKLQLTVSDCFKLSIHVHNREVGEHHPIWETVNKIVQSVQDILDLLVELKKYKVCVGNHEETFTSLVPVGAAITTCGDTSVIAYREGNFGACDGGISYQSTIRTTYCDLLILNKFERCKSCGKTRKMLKLRSDRKEKIVNRTLHVDWTNSNYRNEDMPREVLLKKLEQQQDKIASLQQTVAKLERKLSKKISTEGVVLNEIQNIEMKDLMSTCTDDVTKSFPDSNSYQRLFWSQQQKAADLGKYGMRWHPMIIRWCLAIRQKSQAAYDTIRDAGFVTLPSNRTLFDYSHYIGSELGFQADVLKMLHSEATKLDMFNEDWRKYVGILFDEIKIKEDLVYDKVTGELIGYCNLDSIGNSLLNLESALIQNDKENVAKFVLVLMVRGIVTALKFPLAAFATLSITADFLYPIVWNAVSLLEVHLKLRVLFFTCDGASSNRKFFSIHKLPGFNSVHFTKNPFYPNRNVYFISDVPHLLKTARNCFSNSFSHKKTRRLWKDGKDISWMHIVRLFEDHCEFNMYTPCPKLSRQHIDLNAFSYMKVSLAAQILSDSVANALEDNYGESVAETVLFIRNMNKFFDILNVRSLQEARNKRNPNLNAFRTVTDERLTWLCNDFLNYFNLWAESVAARAGPFTKKDRAGMLLSRQTISGLKITVNSVTESVIFMLNEGAEFILTSCFNQDPLEQHFGHYRHKGGHNKNPTVNDVRHMLTSIRTIGAQALAPRRGNTEVLQERQPIDNTKLPKRR